MIKTVTGWIDDSQVGYSYVHEHLYTNATPEVVLENSRMAVNHLEKVHVDLQDFKALGGNLIVDVTTIDYGRDINKLKELSELSGVYIVATGGFNKGKFNREFLEKRDIDDVIKDLKVDVESEVGVGVLKIGTSLDKIEPWELKGLMAISAVHKETGVPITTHTEKGTMALQQVEHFKQEGVDLSKVIIGHMDQNPDFEIHRELIKQGVYIGYDSIPKTKYNTKDRSIEFIVKLAKQGQHKQVVLSGDFARKDYYRGYNGVPGLGYLLTEFKDELSQRLLLEGLDAQVIIDDLFTNNPVTVLSYKK